MTIGHDEARPLLRERVYVDSLLGIKNSIEKNIQQNKMYEITGDVALSVER